MSWCINFVAKSKGAALAKIEHAKKENSYFPKEIADSLMALVEHVSGLAPGKGIQIDSHGHISATDGSGEAKIRIVDIIE